MNSDDILWLDFETLSLCNLTTQGLQRYVEDESTEVLCLGYAFNDEEPECWYPEDNAPFPARIIKHVNARGTMYAHNAQFDLQIWNYILANDFPVPAAKLSQWRCSATRAMAHGLPAGLKNLCIAINLPIQKQKEGQRLVMQYSCRGRQPWENDDKQLMTDYCNMDVATMRMACSIMRELTPSEWAEYHNNHRICTFGVPIDVEFATAALNYSDDVKADVNNQIQKLTDGTVEKATSRKSRDRWVFSRITEKQKTLLAVVKNKGKEDEKTTYSFDKEHRDQLMAAADLHPDVEALRNLIDDAGGSATSKYGHMVNTHVDGRVNYALTWHGAATSRWTSKGLQVHNMIRDAFEEPEELIQDVLGDYEIPTPAKTLSRLLRASITAADGVTFGDWSAIEGRMCPWLSDDPRAQDVLDVFRVVHPDGCQCADCDIYIHTAEGMGMDDRQAGKVAALSMQFAGGAGALQRMAKKYGVVYTDDEAEHLKQLWRRANQWCEDFWKGLKRAAWQAYRNPNTLYACGKLEFFYDDGDWLWMRRPSGNLQGYFQPRMEEVEYPWDETGFELTVLAGSVPPKSGQPWPRRTLTAGVLIENATQGAAADLMREAVMNATDLPIILHCHDELVAEGNCADDIQEIMDFVPDWAEGLPLKTEVKFKQRYGK